MNITLIEPNKPLFTLLARDRETGQLELCTYNSSAILTTNHAELICYTANLIGHYGQDVVYTISSVSEVSAVAVNALSNETEYKTVSAYAGAKVRIPK